MTRHVVILFISNDNRRSGWTIAPQTDDEIIALIADEALQHADDEDDMDDGDREHLGVAVLAERDGAWEATTTTPDGDQYIGAGPNVGSAMHDLRCKVGARENWDGGRQ